MDLNQLLLQEIKKERQEKNFKIKKLELQQEEIIRKLSTWIKYGMAKIHGQKMETNL